MAHLPLLTAQDVLLVIDVQNDFCPGGALEVKEGDKVVDVINSLIPKFENVVLTQDWHTAGHSSFASSHDGKDPFSEIEMPYGPQTLWPDHCVQGTKGAELHQGLQAASAQLILRKGFHPEIDSYSAFFENDLKTPTGLTGYLRERGIGRVFCVGLAYDFCVRFSAQDAIAQGFDCFVISEATRAIDLDGSFVDAHSSMSQAGVRFL